MVNCCVLVHAAWASEPRDPYPRELSDVKKGIHSDLPLLGGNVLEDVNLIADPEKNFAMIITDGKIYKNAL